MAIHQAIRKVPRRASPARRLIAGLLTMAMLAVLMSFQAAPASAASGKPRAPAFYMTVNTSSTTNSSLRAFFSSKDGDGNYKRWSIKVRAGSGSGATHPCDSDDGPLPPGIYGGPNRNSGTIFKFRNKTGGSKVIRGHVWELGSRYCGERDHPLMNPDNNDRRTELFLHTNGIEGTAWDGNYKSEGCIKVSQASRLSLTYGWGYAWGTKTNKAFLRVYDY